MTPAALLPPAMLAASNLFMNVAWYGHLKAPGRALWLAVIIAWGIAFFEYCLAVPANRIGAGAYSLAQLKTIQEVMSLGTFVLVAWWLFGVKPSVSTLLGFVLIAGGAFLVFKAPFG